MEQVFEQPLMISPGLCDASGLLAVHEVFRVFMDIAAAHAAVLGCGMKALAPKKLFWLTVKTGADFTRRPRMGETVRLRTWPEAPGRMRCERSYEIADRDGNRLIAGKTEWAVINTETGQLAPMADIYPGDLAFTEPTARAAAFARIPDSAGDFEDYDAYRVKSTDIDLGGHMNNTAYVRALLGSFSNAALKEMRIRGMDLIYRAPCYEGETLTLSRRKSPEGLDLRMAGEKGTVLLSRIESEM